MKLDRIAPPRIADGWERGDWGADPIEIADADEQRDAELFAQTLIHEALADEPDRVTAVRALLWAVEAGADEDAVATVERTR